MNALDLSHAEWRKSSRSGTTNCVEVAWRKSSRSGGTNCVEVASMALLTAVRDSKNPDGPILAFPASSWTTFLRR
jgi:Domain of unknown function (DUF397)